MSVCDIVCEGERVAEVIGCAADENGKLVPVVKLLQHVRSVTPHSELVVPTVAREVWEANVVFMPRAWYLRRDGLVIIR